MLCLRQRFFAVHGTEPGMVRNWTGKELANEFRVPLGEQEENESETW
jgi:hypothetical protein